MGSLGEFGVAVREVEDREPDTFDFCGQTFTVGVAGLIPLGKFAKAAVSGVDSSDMEGLAAILDMLSDTVVDEDRGRFLEVATRNRAQADDLMPIIQAVIQAQSGHPTQRPSDSSGGPLTTGQSLTAPLPSAGLSPIQQDPRIRELQPVDAAGLSLVG